MHVERIRHVLNEELLQPITFTAQNNSQHMLTLVCIMYSSPIQKCGDQQTCIKMEKLFRILISMHIITSTIATAM